MSCLCLLAICFEDSSLIQTFGDFLDQQLLPLYVRDVDLNSLGEAPGRFLSHVDIFCKNFARILKDVHIILLGNFAYPMAKVI